MNENVSSRVLERLRPIGDRRTTIAWGIQGLAFRVTALDGLGNSISTSIAGLNARMARFDERLSRVERRLDPRDVH